MYSPWLILEAPKFSSSSADSFWLFKSLLDALPHSQAPHRRHESSPRIVHAALSQTEKLALEGFQQISLNSRPQRQNCLVLGSHSGFSVNEAWALQLGSSAAKCVVSLMCFYGSSEMQPHFHLLLMPPRQPQMMGGGYGITPQFTGIVFQLQDRRTPSKSWCFCLFGTSTFSSSSSHWVHLFLGSQQRSGPPPPHPKLMALKWKYGHQISFLAEAKSEGYPPAPHIHTEQTPLTQQSLLSDFVSWLLEVGGKKDTQIPISENPPTSLHCLLAALQDTK